MEPLECEPFKPLQTRILLPIALNGAIGLSGNYVAKSSVTLAGAAVAQGVAFAHVFDGDDGVGHGEVWKLHELNWTLLSNSIHGTWGITDCLQMTSAKVFSVLRKYQIPRMRKRAITNIESAKPGR